MGMSMPLFAMLMKKMNDTIANHAGGIYRGANCKIDEANTYMDSDGNAIITFVWNDADTNVDGTGTLTRDMKTKTITCANGLSAFEEWKVYNNRPTATYADFFQAILDGITENFDDKYLRLDQNPYQHYDENGNETEFKSQIENAQADNVLYLDSSKKVTTGAIQTYYANLIWNREQDTTDTVNNVCWGVNQQKAGKVVVNTALEAQGLGTGGGECKMASGTVTNKTVGALVSGTSVSNMAVADVLDAILVEKFPPEPKIEIRTGSQNYGVSESGTDNVYTLKFTATKKTYAIATAKIERQVLNVTGDLVDDTREVIKQLNSTQITPYISTAEATEGNFTYNPSAEDIGEQSLNNEVGHSSDRVYGYRYFLTVTDAKSLSKVYTFDVRVIYPSYTDGTERLLGKSQYTMTCQNDYYKPTYAYCQLYGSVTPQLYLGGWNDATNDFTKTTSTRLGVTYETWTKVMDAEMSGLQINFV